MQTQTSNTLHNAIMEADSKDRPPMLAPDIEVPVSEGSPITTTARIHETYKNVSQEIRDQLNAEVEAIQIILTGIDNDIYSTVDACLNACEMWKAIESDDKLLSNEVVLIENFKIYSNTLFDDEESISTKIDPHYFNAKSNLLESLLNRDTLIEPSPKFDYFLEEFSGELAHIDPIPPGIKEANFDLQEEIRLVENLLLRMAIKIRELGQAHRPKTSASWEAPHAYRSLVLVMNNVFVLVFCGNRFSFVARF
nr:hypothetical protein [Tanacetum cinerariifolium]